MRIVFGFIVAALIACAAPSTALLSQSAEPFALGSRSNTVIPTADIVCTITTGNCTGVSGGSSLFKAATCNGVADDNAAFTSFKNFIVKTWQASYSGLVQLNLPNGARC